MDRRLQTYRYPCVGLLEEHDSPDHLGDVNGSRKERLQIRLRKRRLIRTHSCGAIILPVSPVRHNGREGLTLDFGFDIIFWFVKLSNAHT
jgi:hypothetical protein